MGDYNKKIIIGRLCDEPFPVKIKRSSQCHFTVCSSYVSNDREIVTNYYIVTRGKLAKIAEYNLHKGNLCCVEGKIVSDDSGGHVEATRVVVLSSYKKDLNQEKSA